MEDMQEKIRTYVNSHREGSILEALDIKLVSAEKEKIVATMTIGPNNRQQLGYLHGGASVVLAESLASLGSALIIDQTKQMAFGLEINANHVRPKRDGIVTGVAELLAHGRTTHIWEINIRVERDKLICISRCTVAIVDQPPPNDNPFVQGLLEQGQLSE